MLIAAPVVLPPPPSSDEQFTVVLVDWLAAEPRYYLPVQQAARVWLSREQ